MHGQWIGTFTGTNQGLAIVDLDDFGSYCEGGAVALDQNASLPPIYLPIRTPNKEPAFELSIAPKFVESSRGIIVEWDQIKNRYADDVKPPTRLETHWQIASEQLSIHWKSDIGTEGEAILPVSHATRPSEYKPLEGVQTWARFKEFAVSQEPQRFIYRGQESSLWRLRTHFHRAGRFHLVRFIADDINFLHANLSSMTQHIFNLDDQVQNGAFYSLIQHHGYPTPLLDWTYSPFIAAFFAYRRLYKSQRSADARVRLFVFDMREWSNDLVRLPFISPAPPHISMLSPLAINNPRMVPQQAVSMVTNVDDMETFVRFHEHRNNKTYLQVIDLPAAERPVIMQELALMGITAGSIFPGLDGACEQLKERMFEL